MATVHVYVRAQVKGTNDQVHAIADAVESVKAAIVAAGGDWNGSATTELDPEPQETVAEAAVSTEGGDDAAHQ